MILDLQLIREDIAGGEYSSTRKCDGGFNFGLGERNNLFVHLLQTSPVANYVVLMCVYCLPWEAIMLGLL